MAKTVDKAATDIDPATVERLERKLQAKIEEANTASGQYDEARATLRQVEEKLKIETARANTAEKDLEFAKADLRQFAGTVLRAIDGETLDVQKLQPLQGLVEKWVS